MQHKGILKCLISVFDTFCSIFYIDSCCFLKWKRAQTSPLGENKCMWADRGLIKLLNSNAWIGDWDQQEHLQTAAWVITKACHDTKSVSNWRPSKWLLTQWNLLPIAETDNQISYFFQVINLCEPNSVPVTSKLYKSWT